MNEIMLYDKKEIAEVQDNYCGATRTLSKYEIRQLQVSYGHLKQTLVLANGEQVKARIDEIKFATVSKVNDILPLT